MRYQSTTPGYDTQSETIRRLENELHFARRTIVELMPEAIASRMLDYHDCRTRRDFYQWQHGVIEAVIATAVPDPEISYHQPRGWCPLCRGGSSGPFDRGYALPGGLTRHLEGRGNTAECPVTKAGFDLARDALRERFEKEEADDAANLQHRRETEPMMLTDPNRPPQLMDDQGWFSHGVRDSTALETAEERLRQFGFANEAEGNVVAWRLRRDGWAVLADPRSVRLIQCVVFREPEPHVKTRRSRTKTARHIETRSFHILDSWKIDILGKFNQRLDQAIHELQSGSRSHR